MANVAGVFRDEIARLSRREIRRLTATTRKATVQHRHHIAALNRKIAVLERQVALLARAARQQQAATSRNDSNEPKIRFVPKGLRSQRNRLGLSAADFGKLVGVSANSVYAWESGTTTPRKEQLTKIAGLRTVGKREAATRLKAALSVKHPTRHKR